MKTIIFKLISEAHSHQDSFFFEVVFHHFMMKCF